MTAIGKINPIRYRGYYYDTETGFYYLQSRYYDPSIGRFINADSFASTGQGFLGCNMFAYCNNAPVLFVDDSGTAPWPTTVVMSDATASSRKVFTDKDQAAIDFARKNYPRSRREGIEYGAIIYSKTTEGFTRYTYGKTLKGTTESIETSLDVDNYLLASGWSVTGFIHTHPNYSSFSRDDLDAHSSDVMINPTFSTYVVFGPNANSFIIRKLQGIGDYLVYPILDRGSSWISSTRVNEKR